MSTVAQSTLKRKACNTYNVIEKILIDNVNLQMQITPHTTRCSPSFGLPDGWKIEKKPRINTTYSDSDKVSISFSSVSGFSLPVW